MTPDQVWEPTVFDVNADPNSTAFLASHPEQLHKLPQDYNAFGDYIRANQLLQNGDVTFDDFVSGELFEDAIQDEDLLDPHDEDYLNSGCLIATTLTSKPFLDACMTLERSSMTQQSSRLLSVIPLRIS